MFNTSHGECLSSACLTITKDGAIISFYYFLNYISGAFVINLFLGYVLVVGIIKSECLGLNASHSAGFTAHSIGEAINGGARWLVCFGLEEGQLAP